MRKSRSFKPFSTKSGAIVPVETILTTLLKSVGGELYGTLQGLADAAGQKFQDFIKDPEAVKAMLKKLSSKLLSKLGGLKGILEKLKKFWEKIKSWITGRKKQKEVEEEVYEE